ncbi:copper resistance protein B [Phenylobacterium sp.]|uniref:copper resistance protein B n=1 Tax=Phenylobacterium sp. TaxID=1871053 RepID=UPI00301BA3C1
MKRLSLLIAGLAAPALAQPADPHAHHRPAPQASAPAAPADPHAHHQPVSPGVAADPHAAHAPPAADPHAHHRHTPDPHAGHNAPAASQGTPPPVPTDHAAERIFPADRMAAARERLRHEHGGMRWTTVRVETAEIRPESGSDGYAWEGEVSWGGDVDRLVVKTEGEGNAGDLESAEVHALWRRAIGPYFNVQGGVRQDFQPRPRRTYAALGIEGVAPYWFEVGATAFLSSKGDLSARLEAAYDLRLTQKLILEPLAEASLAASSDRAVGVGSGLSEIEAGLRIRYDIQPEVSPYVGVHWARKVGRTADFARAAGEHVEDTRAVVGLKAWF